MRGMAAHPGPVSVIPRGDTALFEISSDGKTALVTSREGALTLSDGIETASLEPGYTAKLDLDVSPDQDQGPKPAAKSKGEKKSKGFILWILVGAGIGAGITCAVTCGGGGPTPVSPVTP